MQRYLTSFKRLAISSLFLLGASGQPLTAARSSTEDLPGTCYLFAYFLGNGEDGLHLAWSRDGDAWEALNGGASYLRPTVGKEKLMRDPCITRGQDGVYHMVWTEGPTALRIGDETLVYFDCYTKHRYGALATRDFKSWKDVTAKLEFPKGARHGNAFPVARAVVQQLIASEAKQPEDPLSWSNPILPQRADPHVLLHGDGHYYFTATVPGYDRIEIRRSRTLGGLPAAEAKVVWHKHASGPMSHHIWAPEIHHLDGKWYIYFAAGRAEAVWDIRMYVLENPSPNPLEGEWAEKGQIKMNWESFTLDATTFEHGGSRYLAWAQSAAGEKGTGIYLAKMDSPWSITGSQVRLTKPELPWETIGHNVNEAPAVLHRNGRLFMTYSASATDANYCLGMLVAKDTADLLDPQSWAKSPSPVFKSNSRNSQFGPGHNSFTTTPDGKTDILIYHSRAYEKIKGDPLNNPDRATRAQVFGWKANGTPDFGIPAADGPLR